MVWFECLSSKSQYMYLQIANFVMFCRGLRHTPSLASIPRPLPYGELPSLDLSNQEPLTHVFSKEPLLLVTS